MVLAINDLTSLLDAEPPAGNALRNGTFLRPQDAHVKDEEACLKGAVSTIRRALGLHSVILMKASEFFKKNNSDPRLTGFKSYSDHQLLTHMDQLAAVSLIHADYARDVHAGTTFLKGWRSDFESWSDDAESLLRELEYHETNLNWVSQITQKWSETLGKEYDRRHPDVTELPFTPVDLGPTNSARLPPVL